MLIDEISNDNLLKLTFTANRELKSISIDDKLLEDKEMLEDYLIITINKAIKNASKINETELAAAAKDGLPNIPGMDFLNKVN